MKASLGSSKSLLSNHKSMFEEMGAKEAKRPVKDAHVSKADNGGYLVEHHQGFGEGKKHVFKNLKGVHEHLKELLEPAAEEKGETAAEEKAEGDKE